MLPVPVGTVVRDDGSGEWLGEVLETGDEIVVARGGRGGRGNLFFVNATHQAPREWQPGEAGEQRTWSWSSSSRGCRSCWAPKRESLHPLGDSAGGPKIAEYSFTTLIPNLGVVQLSDHRTFVVADIPGIIEGAHEGKGLGLRFLRHIERTRVLAFLIPVDTLDWQEEYRQLRHEVASYSAELAQKPHCVVFTKMDLLGGDPRLTSMRPTHLRHSRSAQSRAPVSIRCSLHGGPSCKHCARRRCGRVVSTPTSSDELVFGLALAGADAIGIQRYYRQRALHGSAETAFLRSVPQAEQRGLLAAARVTLHDARTVCS